MTTSKATKVSLVTGASGFVARYLISELLRRDEEAYIVGVDIIDWINREASWAGRFENRKVDLIDAEATRRLIAELQPSRIYHLASFSSVSYSWDYPVESFNNNTNIFLNILEAVRREDIKARVLSVGSSEEYGNVSEHEVPLKETAPLKPTSPYGVARVSQELLSRVYVEGFGLDIVMTRSFNHIGPYQREIFVIPGFIKQFTIAEKEGKREFMLRTGDVDVVRDFSDVRDVVRAYAMLMEEGLTSEVYNVCSGTGQNLSDLIGSIGRLMGMKAEVLRDSALGRPSENRIIVGDRTKISSLCGWAPSLPIEKTLGDTIEYWRLVQERQNA